jgi:hypothetical protein
VPSASGATGGSTASWCGLRQHPRSAEHEYGKQEQFSDCHD